MVMPDLLLVFSKRWKLILLITVSAIIIAFIFTFLSPRKFLATATALPANSVFADKARIFNQNIQELYSDFGSADELDKIEGTGKLDTLFIAASEEFKLDRHYNIPSSDESVYNAALRLKKNCKISRSGYGELKIKVWDEDKNICAQLANFLMKEIQELHQHLQNESNISTLAKIKETYALKEKEYMQLSNSVANDANPIVKAKMATLTDQLQTYQKMMDEYQLAIDANAPVLLVVENARSALLPDQPRVMETILFVFFGSFAFSFLLALFIESRKPLV